VTISVFLMVLALGQEQISSPRGDSAHSQDRQTRQEPSGDIIVESYRINPDVKTKTGAVYSGGAPARRQQYALAERLAKCAARSKLANSSYLSAVVDGAPNSAPQRYAQDRLYRIYISCGESTSFLSLNSPPAPPRGPSFTDVLVNRDFSNVAPGTSEGAPLGQSVIDRGAFTVQAIKQFAPSLALTRQQTNDPAVQARFNKRELARNRFRLPADYKYFAVAVCMVRVAPELSVKLAKSEGAAKLSGIQSALVDRARICVGDAREVKLDATEFRLYIADAVYRWAVAAEAVESLIPQ
jgi:hypothetical protein